MKVLKIRILHAMLLVLGVLIIAAGHMDLRAWADDGGSAIEQAKTNVFRIEVSMICEGKSEPELVSSGTCFIVGNEEKDQEQHLITAKSNLDVSDKSIKKYRKKHKLKEDDTVEILYEVVISEDIRRLASVYDRAQDSDYAILKLDETIKGCSGLTIGDPLRAKDEAAIFLLVYDEDGFLVNLESSHLGQADEKKIFFEAQESESYGAPVVDESGNLLGVKIPQEVGEEKLAEGLSANVLKDAFDTLGIPYENSDSKISVLEDKIEDARKKSRSGNYTKKTTEVLEEAIREAEEICDDAGATDSDYEDQTEELEKAMEQLKPMKEIYRLVMLVLAGVIFLVVLVIIIVQIRNRKREKHLQYYSQEPSGGQKHKEGKKAKKRRELSADDDRTVVLSEKRPTAYLIHKNSGTRLLIAKDFYVLGSKEGMTDYRITGNPAVSRRHAAIVNENGILFLQDMESRNHSFVNDRQLEIGEKAVIRNRDVIRLANEEFVFELR